MNLARKLLDSDSGLAALLAEFLERFPATVQSDELDRGYWDHALLDPARDILERSGKGVRARLLERCWRLAGGSPEGPPDMLPVLIELLHVGSLVIDDIEDDSWMRRGGPALHRRYGVPVALNTGNWLYFLPMVLLSRLDAAPSMRLALYEDMSFALLRCHQGQALDLSVKVTALRRHRVPVIVERASRLKTGSLMELAAVLGARTAGARDDIVTAIGQLGSDIGVGLQMLDDWSSIHVEQRRAKGIEDLRLGRPTWPWAWHAGGSDDVAFTDLQRRARDASTGWEFEQLITDMQSPLATLAPTRIDTRLREALDAVAPVVGGSEALADLRGDIDELERAYG